MRFAARDGVFSRKPPPGCMPQGGPMGYPEGMGGRPTHSSGELYMESSFCLSADSILASVFSASIRF